MTVAASWLFHGGTGLAVIVLRRRLPEFPRPYRVALYPWTPLAFAAASVALVGNSIATEPGYALAGLSIAALGVPVLAFIRRNLPQPSGVQDTP